MAIPSTDNLNLMRQVISHEFGSRSRSSHPISQGSKHGKPVSRRDVVEKYLAMGAIALERAFNSGDRCPDPA